jgi:hypothetical protein
MDYRAYRLDRQGHISNRIDFVADGDAAAIEHARRYLDGHDVEVWQRGRQIALLKQTDKH